MSQNTTPCAHCGEDFTPTRAGHIYCGKNCRNRAWVNDKPRVRHSRAVIDKKRDGGREVTCAECDKAFTTNANRKVTKCNQCKHEHMKRVAAAKGPCGVDGCGSPQFCKGMCSKHYWESRSKIAPRETRLYERECEWCGKLAQSADRYSRHCSLECAVKTREGWSKSTALTLRRSPERIARIWAGKALPARDGMPLVAGPCAHCGNNFVGKTGSLYCSTRCHEGASWRRRYDARGEFYINPRTRQEIYARDGWTCQLCGDPVDKDAPVNTMGAPTLDHIIPQSLQLVPDHSPSNLRLAHLLCNSKRGNRQDVDLIA